MAAREGLPTEARRGPAASTAMADGLDRWRDFFRGAGAGICDVIENAILVAAGDAPRELLHRRDRIAERLFTTLRRDAAPPAPPSFGSAAASTTPATPVEEDKGSVRRVAEKECKVDSSSNGAHGGGHGHGDDEDDDSDSDDERLRRAAASNYGHSYDDDDDEDDDQQEEDEQRHAADDTEEGEEDHGAEELEALTNEIDEESQIVGEVIRIKELLLHKEDHVLAHSFTSSIAKVCNFEFV